MFEARANGKIQSNIRAFELATVFWSVALIFYSYACGVLFDYRHYVEQWQLMLSGGDPWSTDNSYGPLHNLIGYLDVLSPLAPKMLMVGALLLANFMLVRQLLLTRGASWVFVVYGLAVPFNVLTIGIGIVFGLNDAFVAALLVFAVLGRIKDRDALTGLSLGLAALLKFYPLLLVPLFALDKDYKIRWRLVVWSSVIFCFGMLAAYSLWGIGVLNPLRFGSSRGPSFMSIFSAAEPYLGDQYWFHWLVMNNAVVVVVGVIFVVALSYWRQIVWLEAVVIGYLVLLSLYKVGHQQFFLGWLFMVPTLHLLKLKTADRLAICLIPMVVFLSVLHFAFDLGTNLLGNRPGWITTGEGFISFPIEIVSIVLCFFAVWRGNKASPLVHELAS